jgi:hypothetical protein
MDETKDLALRAIRFGRKLEELLTPPSSMVASSSSWMRLLHWCSMSSHSCAAHLSLLRQCSNGMLEMFLLGAPLAPVQRVIALLRRTLELAPPAQQ